MALLDRFGKKLKKPESPRAERKKLIRPRDIGKLWIRAFGGTWAMGTRIRRTDVGKYLRLRRGTAWGSQDSVKIEPMSEYRQRVMPPGHPHPGQYVRWWREARELARNGVEVDLGREHGGTVPAAVIYQNIVTIMHRRISARGGDWQWDD